MNELALFAGIGGGILGGKLLGWRCVCAVEIDPYCRERLMQRQNEGHLDPFPIWDDVTTFDGRPWRGVVDVVSGGFPCQDISVAGRGAGIDGERSGLWSDFARIISDVRPRFVIVENSPALVSRGLGRVLGDLATMGYNAKWGVLGADAIGYGHRRARLWLVANSSGFDVERRNTQFCNQKAWEDISDSIPVSSRVRQRGWRSLPAPYVLRSGNGFPNRVERTRAIGNAQVPGVVELAWKTLIEEVA